MNQSVDNQHSLSICQLSERSIFKITGEDSSKFMQGQLSCDMREVDQSHSLLGSHCNPKGSMLSIMRVQRIKDEYYLTLNSQNLAPCIANLNKYIMFSKAQTKDINSQWTGFGIFGEQAQKFIERQFSHAPQETGDVVADADRFVVKVPGNRFELWLKSVIATDFLAQPIVNANLLEYNHWKKQEILNAIADINPLNSACYIPQMCNLQVFSGISFKKGCYTGQEVITRLHFRGKLNKFLIIAKCPSEAVDNSLAIGSAVNCEARDTVGKVLQYVTLADSTYLQIVVNFAYAQESLSLTDGTLIQTLDLPYPLDPELFVRKT